MFDEFYPRDCGTVVLRAVARNAKNCRSRVSHLANPDRRAHDAGKVSGFGLPEPCQKKLFFRASAPTYALLIYANTGLTRNASWVEKSAVNY